ncbi:hypothetical protein [Pseudobutyrivibrio sp.]|uniref:hypothetical protein n=1 Tax=Pseudobutyrivibrio sp. TaxID=2014367 RepID=UPI001D984EAF|nr:hypothetical protein [Pseudobutyrivibrio sp.]MBE5912349.1 hypothetical protein [Pseudobutyrivibrio sp.]
MDFTMRDLKAKELLEYDFLDDWKEVSNIEIYDEFVDTVDLDKYFIYKMATLNNKPDEIYKNSLNYWEAVRDKYARKKGRGYVYCIEDPDTYSEKLQNIYKAIYEDNYLNITKDNEGRICGDTMNSITTTMSKYFRLIYADDEKYYRSKIKGNGFINECGKPYNGSLSQSLEIYIREKDSEKLKESISEDAKNFIRYSHTLGNFIPVPAKTFNVPRSTSTKDYWDLTLLRIYNWYKENESSDKSLKKDAILKTVENECDCNKNKELCLLLGRNRANVKLCIKWLCEFGSWDSFVKKNYMQSFVIEEGNGNYGEPLELWKGHFERNEDSTFKNPMPLCKEQCEEFFKNATERIKERSENMAEKFQQNNR